MHAGDITARRGKSLDFSTLSEFSVTTALDCYGDPVKLSWVLSSLVANAIRVTPEGGSVEVSAGRDGQSLRISVSDSGRGVPLELRDVLLEQRPQWKPEGLDNGSAGLSLAIAKEIVEAHGGRIFLDSSTKGSTFVIQLPRSRCI